MYLRGDISILVPAVFFGKCGYTYRAGCRVSKNREFYANFKNANLPWWQNAPQKSYNWKTKKMGLGKIRKQFLIITFLGGILSLRQVFFF